MPADLNKSLEACEAQARALVQEMKQYKAARELNQKSADALDKVGAALARAVEEIKPLTASRVRRYMFFQTIAWAVTTILVILLAVLMYLKMK
jgi:HD superfamily phosphodiesterase